MSSRTTTLRFRPLRAPIRAASVDAPIELVNLSRTSLTAIAIATLISIGVGIGFGMQADHGIGMLIGGLVFWILAVLFILRDWWSARIKEQRADAEIARGLIMQQIAATDQEVRALRRQAETSITNQQKIMRAVTHLASEMGVDPVELAANRVEMTRQRIYGSAAPAAGSFAPFLVGEIGERRPSLDNVRTLRPTKN